MGREVQVLSEFCGEVRILGEKRANRRIELLATESAGFSCMVLMASHQDAPMARPHLAQGPVGFSGNWKLSR